MNFATIDIVIVAVYFIVVFGVGIYYSQTKKNSTEYFLAGKDLGWLVIGMSLFATNISSEHVIGLAGSVYVSGLGNLNLELIGAATCILLSWTFGRYYIRNHIFTMPEFIEKRFNSFCRIYLSIGSIFAYILTKISVLLLAGALFLEKIAGIDLYTSSIVLVVITGIYTVSGGFTSVVYTAAIQGVIMIAGGLILTVMGLHEVGGLSQLLAHTPPHDLHLIREASDSTFPWTGVLFGVPILTIWYHCTDQFFVQKFLVAKDLPNAQAGSIFTAFLKLTPILMYTIPGLIAKVLYPGIESDDAYPTLFMNLMPVGLKGLVIAAFLAALMSSLSSAFASCSTLFTIDIYKKIYPNANDFVIVNVGRIMTFVIVIFAIIWVIFIKSLTGELYGFMQSVTAYIAPPITAIFVTAILWSKANEKGASVSLITGFLLGISRFIVEILMSEGIITSGILWEYGNIHFLHFAAFLFAISVSVIVLVSFFTGGAPSMDKVEGLTYKYAHAGKNVDMTVENQGTKLMRTMNIAASVLFIAIVIGIYIFLQSF